MSASPPDMSSSATRAWDRMMASMPASRPTAAPKLPPPTAPRSASIASTLQRVQSTMRNVAASGGAAPMPGVSGAAAPPQRSAQKWSLWMSSPWAKVGMVSAGTFLATLIFVASFRPPFVTTQDSPLDDPCFSWKRALVLSLVATLACAGLVVYLSGGMAALKLGGGKPLGPAPLGAKLGGR